MELYYCDACGKRLSAADLDAGLAKDKQAHEIRCPACANDAPAQPIAASQPGNKKSARHEPGGSRAQETTGTSVLRARPQNKPAQKSTATWGLAGGAGVAVLLIIAYFATRTDPPQPAQSAKAPTVATGEKQVAPPDNENDQPEPADLTKQAMLEIRAQREQKARELFNQAKVLLADAGQKSQGAGKLEELAEKYGGTLAAADAKSLLATVRPVAATNRNDPAPAANSAQGEWVEITTTSGKDGLSGYIRQHQAGGAFGSDLLLKHAGPGRDVNRKIYLRFDSSSIDFSVKDAAVRIHVTTLPEVSQKIVLYGITDEALDDVPLSKDTAWANAPANNPDSPFEPNKSKAMELAASYVNSKNNPAGTGVEFRGQTLADFINANKNGKLTFMIGRATKDGSNMTFAGDSSETPPALRVKK